MAVLHPAPAARRSKSAADLDDLLDKLELGDAWVPPYPVPIRTAIESDAGCLPGLYALPDLNNQQAVRMVEREMPSYDVACVPGVLDRDNDALAEMLKARGIHRVFSIVDSAIPKFYGPICEEYFATHKLEQIPFVLSQRQNNEDNKSLPVYAEAIDRFMDHRPGKGDGFAVIGGGVAKDLGGFIAATLRRQSMPYFVVPTTAACQTDAALSPKTAVNSGRWKNAAGAIHPPAAVLVDPAFLSTQDRRSLLTGAAELLKLGIVRSELLFEVFEHYGDQIMDEGFQGDAGARVIPIGIRIFLKMKYEPPFPGNRPASLRAFGHAFSRELEALAGYRLTHGEAVSVEMAVASSLSCRAGFLATTELCRILHVLDELGLPRHCPECSADLIWPVFERRFRASDHFYFPVPTSIGRGTFLDRFTKDDLKWAIDICRNAA